MRLIIKQVNMKKSVLIMVFAVLAGTAFGQAAQKPQKIGSLNMEYVLSAMPEIKSIQSQLETLSSQLQKQGEAKQAQYQQKAVKYQTEGQTMTIGDRQALERDIASLEEELKQFSTSAQTKIENKQVELMGPINKKIADALQAIVDEQGYTHVINIGVPQAGLEILYYVDPAYDLSNAVLKKLGIDPPVQN